MSTKLKELSSELERLKTNIKDELMKHLKEFTKEYFTKYPFVNSISWKQYTNYWNDGEACYFSVQTPEIEFTQEYLEANPTLREELKKHYYENSIPCEEGSDEEYIDDCNKFYSLLCEYDEYFKLILGDHIKVIITKDKIRTEDYSDHD